MSHAPPLTVRRRACLLRAAQKRLEHLGSKLAGLEKNGDIGGQMELLKTEFRCLSDGIHWLWSQPATDDGK